MAPKFGTRHLTTRLALDHLEQRLTGRPLEEVERHLGTPCPRCREMLRKLGEVVEKLRAGPLEQPPGWLERRALEVFQPQPRAAGIRAAASRLLEMVFDSRTAPMPATARRAVGESRRLRFAGGPCTIELESDVESAEWAGLRGRLTVEQPALHRIEVRAGDEQRTVWADDSGAFAVDRLPRRRLQIRVTGPSGSYRLPPFTP